MKILLLAKPFLNATVQGRLGPDLRLDRAVIPAVINGNDEYALEAALKLHEAAGEGSRWSPARRHISASQRAHHKARVPCPAA